LALRNIVKLGDERLRKMSKPVTVFDEKLWELLDDMKQTMYENNGMGIAAVQVGILKRAIIIDVNDMYLELINPEIINQKGSDIEKEGCLSVCEEKGYVKRPIEVTVRAHDRMGYPFTITGEKYLARAICHEVDHLNGILFIDRVIKDYKVK
jgi:peptide deformylase